MHQDVVLPLVHVVSCMELDRDVGRTIEEVAVLFYHEIRVEHIAVRFVKRLTLALLEYFFVDVHGLNRCDGQAVLEATCALFVLFFSAWAVAIHAVASKLAHFPKWTRR